MATNRAGKKAHLTAAVPASLRSRLRRRARASGLTDSELVRRLLREGMDRMEVEDLLRRIDQTPADVIERQIELAHILDLAESTAR